MLLKKALNSFPYAIAPHQDLDNSEPYALASPLPLLDFQMPVGHVGDSTVEMRKFRIEFGSLARFVPERFLTRLFQFLDGMRNLPEIGRNLGDRLLGIPCYGELTPMTDAGSVLSGILEDHLGKFPVHVRENQLLLFDPSDDDNEGKRVDLGGAMLTITPDFDFLTNVGISLGCVLAKVEEDIASQEADDNNHGFVPGRAFPRWLLNMRGWAIENGFRYGAFTAEEFPSQFSGLLFEVNGYFGTHARGEDWKLKGLKDPVASVEALADRLKKVSRSAAKVSGKKRIGVNARA